MSTNIEEIRKLREETGAGVLDVKKALEKNKGGYEKTKAELLKKGLAAAEKKAGRTAKDGLVHSYIHAGEKVGSMVVVACETDFVAKTDDFKKLCHEVALQVCTGDYQTLEELLNSLYIKDENKKMSQLVAETTAKVGEKIEIKKFVKFSVND